jgi:hypothetical protein
MDSDEDHDAIVRRRQRLIARSVAVLGVAAVGAGALTMCACLSVTPAPESYSSGGEAAGDASAGDASED